jgi:hypothetical protein
MWRVQRLDQINAFKPANLFDFKSLALKIRKKQIGRFKTVIRPQRFDEVPTLRSCGFREWRFGGSTATGIEPRFLEADFRHGCLRRVISPTPRVCG